MNRAACVVLLAVVLFGLVASAASAGGGIIKRSAGFLENGDEVWLVPTGKVSLFGQETYTAVNVYRPNFWDLHYTGVWFYCLRSVRARTESALEQILLSKIRK